jgi:5S rRNA maturation endonuclease (ribonuclease M5)
MNASPALDRILDALRDRDCRPRQGTGGQWSARCPAHEDRSPSLSARQIEGQALIFCHAGCTTANVMAALGVSMADLYDEPRGVVYRYDDGRVVHRSPDKGFRQSGRTRGAASLYRLSRVREAVAAGQTIYLVEGEKDVHALESVGLVATTSPMGSANWDKVDPIPLAGATVVLVADHDEQGHRYARQADATLKGIGAAVIVVAARSGKDAADHIAAGYGPSDFLPLNLGGGPRPRLKTIKASAVTERRVAYLWADRIPLGAPTLMPGEEGIGKTLVGIRLMADLTRGRLPGEFHGSPRGALVLAPEDGIADVFVPRLREAGADLDRVEFVVSRERGEEEDAVILPRDLALLTPHVRKFGAALVWVDSLVTVLPDELKSISYKDVAKAMHALGDWAEAERVAIAAPWHLNKSQGSDTAVRIMDSRAFRTAVRSMLLVVADPEAPEGEQRGIVALDKANAGSLAVPALRYRVRSARYTVTEPDVLTGELMERPASCGVADWLGSIPGDGRAVARAALVPSLEREGSSCAWLRQYLTEHGPSPRARVVADAEAEGHSLASIKRAARSLRIHSAELSGRRGDGSPFRHSNWSLAPVGLPSVDTDPTGPTEPTGESVLDPSDPVCAGQFQWAQLAQSGPCHGPEPTGDPTGHVGGTPAPSRLHNVTRLPVRTPDVDPTGCRACGQSLPRGLVLLGRTAHVSGTCPA